MARQQPAMTSRQRGSGKKAISNERTGTASRQSRTCAWARLSRRAFTRAMIGLGLTAPLAAQMLASSGVAMAADKPVYKPTKRGGGGALKVLWWQGPTLLNPHFAVGTKDQDGSRIFYEPLAGWNSDGDLVPVLAAEIPSVENGGLAEDGTVGHLEAQARREVARRPAVHRRRLRLQLAVRRRSGDGGDDHRQLQGRQGRQGRRPHDPRGVQEADAVLGRCLRRQFRHGDPQAPVRALQRRQVARGAGEPRAGRHRPLPVRRFQAGRPGAGQDQPELPHGQPAVLRHHRDEGRR